MAPFLKVAHGDDEFLRHDRLAGVVGPVRSRPVGTIIEFRVVAVVGNRMRVALHEGAGVSEIEVAELSFDCQRRLAERVIGSFGTEMRQLKVADGGVIAEESVGVQGLDHGARRHVPIVVDIEFERRAATLRFHSVVVLRTVGGIADGPGTDCAYGRARGSVRRARPGPYRYNSSRRGKRTGRTVPSAGRLAGPSGGGEHSVLDARIFVGSRDVADVPAVLFVVADE